MMDRVAWLEERRKGIGGSDVAAIMGISPWKTAYQIYLEKRKEVEDWSGNEATDWGTRLEPAIRQWYSDTTGRAVRVPDKILYHKEYPFMLASLDGFTDDNRIVEIKTARGNDGWGEPGTNQIPDVYMLQVQHYMFVTGYPVTDIPVSIGGAPPVLYEVPEDKELQKMILEAGVEFWRRVMMGDPPEPVTFSDIVQRYGKSKAQGAIIASEEDLFLVDCLRYVRAQLKALEAEEEEIKGKLIKTMGDSGDALINAGGDLLVTYKLSKPRVSFDYKSFQKQHPDLYKEFTIVGESSRRFLIKGEK
jgi:putative phage-type endonuclease